MQTLHHVGYVVKSIEEQAPGFVKSLGATWDQQIIHDPLQGAKVTFLRTPGTWRRADRAGGTGGR